MKIKLSDKQANKLSVILSLFADSDDDLNDIYQLDGIPWVDPEEYDFKIKGGFTHSFKKRKLK